MSDTDGWGDDGGWGDDDVADEEPWAAEEDDPWEDEPATPMGPPPPPPDGGGRGRRPGLILLVTALLVVVAIGVVGALEKIGDDDNKDNASSDQLDTKETSSSTSSPSTTELALPGLITSTTAPSVAGSGSSTSSVKRTTTTKVGSTTTAPDGDPEPICKSAGGGTAPPVRADWATFWQTMPKPNDPAKVTVCIDDVTPKVGQQVQISIRVDDPDAITGEDACSIVVSWEGARGNSCYGPPTVPSSPRPTPSEQFGNTTVMRFHTYAAPGAKTITVDAFTGGSEFETSPYSSFAEVQLPITVHS